jgi:hypothetical protein
MKTEKEFKNMKRHYIIKTFNEKSELDDVFGITLITDDNDDADSIFQKMKTSIGDFCEKKGKKRDMFFDWSVI